MKILQGQIWKKGEEYYRVVERERLSVKYKVMTDPIEGEGFTHLVTKKEFCRLIKGAELLTEEP
ncbi:hypothetical protein [Pontiella sulfatireligans]|uniref:Uncharacterized protein n=1 Tax=Pontiella sulfatireligans TaxID=2750658 RepID=A0A6C2UEW5_9BACT|nr:hypothetical protein [Pontiella sulfatireligans]VGO17961.1 hypothetical protein SCARR_00011 [Pontiella sulfatireligans]